MKIVKHNDYLRLFLGTSSLLRFILALGTSILALVPIALGAWQIENASEAAGIITIGIGVVLAMFFIAIVVGLPQGGAGRSGPSLD